MKLRSILYSSVISVLFCVTGFSADVVHSRKEFFIESKKHSVFITQERWDHITEGLPSASDFSGGHDWRFYEAKYLNTDDVVFFDTFENAYIVSSQKGDSLPIIIEKLKGNDLAHFHALFPHEMLTPEFVLDAFVTAFRNNGLDPTKGLFFADHDGFKVAGFYRPGSKRGAYRIMTIFPDLSWRYRIEFKHHREDEFPYSRFLKREAKGKAKWVRHGASGEEMSAQFSEKGKYWPSPIKNLSSQRTKVAEISSDNFVLEEKLKNFLHDTWIDGQAIDVIDLFFADRNKPRKEEFDGLMAVLRLCLGRDSFLNAGDKRAELGRKISLLKVRLSAALKSNMNFSRVGIVQEQLSQTEIPLGPQYGNLAEELFQQMLNFVGYERSVPDASLIAPCINTAKAFVANVVAKLITDATLFNEFNSAGYTLGVSFVSGKGSGNGQYVLSITPLESYTIENSRTDSIRYTMVMVVEGQGNSQIRFRTVDNLRENAVLTKLSSI